MVSKDPDMDCRRYATIALANLACDVLNQVQVVVHGGLRPILAMAQSPDIPSQRHAIMALNNLASNEAITQPYSKNSRRIL